MVSSVWVARSPGSSRAGFLSPALSGGVWWTLTNYGSKCGRMVRRFDLLRLGTVTSGGESFFTGERLVGSKRTTSGKFCPAILWTPVTLSTPAYASEALADIPSIYRVQPPQDPAYVKVTVFGVEV